MSKFIQGQYKPINPAKYVGDSYPLYRSSWEKRVFMWLDEHQSVTSWASEPLKIPYKNPFTGTVHNYIPDLLISYADKYGKQHVELVEIKPLRETLLERAKTKKDKINLAVNMAKWAAAQAWCKDKKIGFRVITERDIWVGKK